MNPTRSFSQGVRVANFSDLPLDGPNVLTFDSSDSDTIVKEIRRYADLPYVFVASASQAQIVAAVLTALKAIHSPCYPYALFATADLPIQHEGDLLDIVRVAETSDAIVEGIDAYAATRLRFPDDLRIGSTGPLPADVEVAIVGGGITGLYAANRLQQEGISCCVIEKADRIGGIWSAYANTTSRVNSSECAYRLIDDKPRANRDHSATREILEDMAALAERISDRLYLETEVQQIQKSEDRYQIRYLRDGKVSALASKGVVLAINDRVGAPREVAWKHQERFRGEIVTGISDMALNTDWQDKKVVIVGMGAFAIENARTALEGGARHVSVVARRHGTVCPKIIDYLNFATPYDEAFRHDNKSNMRNMMYWKKLYTLSGATQPECWMGKIKHSGHTISVSDIWFIGHYLNKIDTVTGSISEMFENGVIVDGQHRIEADVVVNCIGFERNGSIAKSLCGYAETSTINFVDKNFMYLADAYIDDDAFNSFFGSSVLEMVKFYMEVYIRAFDSSRYDDLIRTAGVSRIPIDDRKWSHYIAGATALINNHDDLYQVAKSQVDRRTANFLEKHDLATYIAENRREWFDTHAMLAGKPMPESDCLPYVFEKLLPR